MTIGDRMALSSADDLIFSNRREQPHTPTPGNPSLFTAMPEEQDDVEQ